MNIIFFNKVGRLLLSTCLSPEGVCTICILYLLPLRLAKVGPSIISEEGIDNETWQRKPNPSFLVPTCKRKFHNETYFASLRCNTLSAFCSFPAYLCFFSTFLLLRKNSNQNLLSSPKKKSTEFKRSQL